MAKRRRGRKEEGGRGEGRKKEGEEREGILKRPIPSMKILNSDIELSSHKTEMRSSHCGSLVMNLTGIHEDAGLTPGFTQWIKDLALPLAVV